LKEVKYPFFGDYFSLLERGFEFPVTAASFTPGRLFRLHFLNAVGILKPPLQPKGEKQRKEQRNILLSFFSPKYSFTHVIYLEYHCKNSFAAVK